MQFSTLCIYGYLQTVMAGRLTVSWNRCLQKRVTVKSVFVQFNDQEQTAQYFLDTRLILYPVACAKFFVTWFSTTWFVVTVVVLNCHLGMMLLTQSVVECWKVAIKLFCCIIVWDFFYLCSAYKVYRCSSLQCNIATPLWELTCRMGLHSVTCHST